MKLLFYLMLLFPMAGYTQISLSGKVSDQNKTPVSYVNIMVKHDSLLVAQTITDSLGNYRIKVGGIGSYEVFFQDINFIRQKVSLHLIKDTVVDVKLEEVNNKLSEVIISSRKNIIERKAGKYVIDISNSVIAMGSDAFILLGQTPGLKASSKQIGLVGKSDLIVTVDDKVLQLSGEDLVSFLKTIPSNDIARIEVITNPSAKYEAQGSSGVVNIVMKKSSREGYNATVNVSYKQYQHANFNENASLSINKGKWNVNANVIFATGTDLEEHAIDTYYPNQTWYVLGDGIDKNKSFNSTLDIQYRLSDQTQINLTVLNTNKKSDKKSDYKTNIFDLNHHLDSVSNSSSDQENKNVQSLVGFQLKHNFNTEGKSLIAGAEWLDRGEGSNQDLWNQNYLPFAVQPITVSKIRSTNRTDLDVFTVNSELKLPVGGYELSVGGKATFVNLRNGSKVFEGVNGGYVFDALQSPVSIYKENRQALFSDFKRTFDQWKLQLGLRVEYTQTNGTFQKDYLQFFPSLNIGYSLDDNNNFDLTYGRRINRPGFKLLNPFRAYINAYDYWEGNPFLRPSVTNNLDVSHTFSHTFTTTFSYSNTKDNFEQIAVFQPGNVVSHQALNYMNSNLYQVMLTQSIKSGKWLVTNLQLQGFYKEYLAKISSIADNRAKGWYFMANNQVQLNEGKTVSAEVNFWYQSSNAELESTFEKQYSLDFGLKFLLLQKNLSVGLNVSDILKSNQERFSTQVNNIRQNFYNYWEPRSFRVSLQYKFGDKKVKSEGAGMLNSEERIR
ncbi:TonB-dependent receptor [Pedobacter sp. PAMC26386]|nr:TonB-dependent receptor [Pedobacter sp. PAMC26386]